MLEHRSITDEERMDGLESQLKEARMMAEDADRKYDEVTYTGLFQFVYF
jgi:tropomyosin-1